MDRPEEVVGKDIRSFQATVRNHSSYDFSQYSHTSLKRRLIRILLEHEMSMDELTSRMSSDSGFLESVIRKVTVHTTELFRDPDVWKMIMSQLLPLYAGQEVIRIWHPGCSTGQEIYSMLIVLDHLNLLGKSKVYGSDINQEVIEKAEAGTYKYRFNQSYLENFDKVILNGSGEDYGNRKKHWKRYFQI
jgi:chemotaxis protein methyltransferase CheR